jgi:hypothetical protein
MNALRSLCILLITANIVLAFWQFWRPIEIQYAKPMSDPDSPSLILRQEHLKLEQSKPRLAASACWILGPFSSEKQMQEAWQSLEYIALDMQSSKNVKVIPVGYEVRIPPSINETEAKILLESMLASGINSAHLVTNGNAKNSLSLGQFSSLIDAQKKQKLAQTLGLEAILTTVQSEKTQWQIVATVRNQAGFKQWQAELTPRVPAQPCLPENQVSQ